MKIKVDNLILGAGITGLSTGYHIKGNNYLIIEKEEEAGGLARSQKINGFIFDYSAHLLHCRTRYFYNWVQRNLKEELLNHKRNAWIYSYGVYTKYPFQANLYGLPRRIIKECLEGLLSVKTFSSEGDTNFEKWCWHKFGSGITQYFMIPYNRKFWTLSPKYLTTEWIDGFVPQPNIGDILDGTLGYGKKEFGYHSRFFYPRKEGIEMFVKKLAQRCKNNLVLKKDVCTLHIKEKWVETFDGTRYYFNNLVSTIPLIELESKIVDIAPRIRKLFSKLKFVSVWNLNLAVKREKISSKDWIYFPEENFIFYRVGFPMNFAPNSTPKGYSSIYVDISYSQWEPRREIDVVERAIDDLIKAGILEKTDNISVLSLNDIKYAYVIYNYDWNITRRRIIEFLNERSIYPGGRFGAWHYLSMEGCFLEGKNIARKLNHK